MIGTTFKEFYDKLYYGTDIEMSCKGTDYILSSAGIFDKGRYAEHEIRLYRVEPDKSLTSLYEKRYPKEEESIDNFLNAKLFTGKSFLEIEQNIQVETML